MVEAPSAAQLERMQSLEPISQVRLVHFFSCQMMLHRLVDTKIRPLHQHLFPTILLQADLALITEVAARVDEAVATFEVEHTEELVVPFGDN